MNSKQIALVGLILLLAVLGFMFGASFQSGYVHFSNDGPLGAVSARQYSLPEGYFGVWQETNWVGGALATIGPSFSSILLWLLGPVGYAKFYQLFACLFVGVAAWFCLRRLNFHPAVAVIGGLAAALNGDFFSYACWGLGSLTVAVAFFFLAVAAVGDGAGKQLWARLMLSGFAIGVSVMEGFDNGAIFSLFLAAYVMWVLVIRGSGSIGKRMAKGIGSVAITAVCALLMASAVLHSAIFTQLKGVAMFEETESLEGADAGELSPAEQEQAELQEQQAELEKWQFATQVSLPKKETLRLLVPGLFGFRMDSPEGRQYWGMVGSVHVWDEYLSQPDPDPSAQPAGGARFSGAGFYAGAGVLLIALWGVLRSFSSSATTFTSTERKLIWFWAAMALVSLVLAWGRFAPFYRIFYELPYVDTIRNPYKFVHPLSISLIILFAFGLQGLWRDCLAPREKEPKPSRFDVKKWWKSAGRFDRRWTLGSIAVLALGVWAMLIYMGGRESVMGYLDRVGFRLNTSVAMESQAAYRIFEASRGELMWGLLFIGLTLAVVWLVVAGVFRGSRSRWGFVLIGGILVIDLMRANTPWVVHYSYPERYADTPLYETLSTKAYEHRVSLSVPMLQTQINWAMPRLQNQQSAQSLMQAIQSFMQVYGVEWNQHQFQYYNIQSLDVVQEPRVATDNQAYREAFPEDDPQAQLRMLKLTNTRYLLALGDPFLPPLNDLAGDTNAFRTVMHLNFEQAGDFIRPTVDSNSPLALIEYTEALPRAKLYSNWEVVADPEAALDRLRDPSFDPDSAVVVVDGAIGGFEAVAGADAGSVTIESYEPKHVRLSASAGAPSMLLLNDKFDSNWQVTVDGQPAELMRANYLMRGVFLEPGEHVVEFHFRPPSGGLYVSLLAIAVGGGLCGWLGVQRRKEREANVVPVSK